MGADEAAQVQRHLDSNCSQCTEELAWLRETTSSMRLYGDLDWIAPPPEVVSVVQQQFRQQHRPLPQKKPQRRRLDSIFVSRRMLAVAGALAVVTIVLMGYLLAVLLTQHPSLTATASQVAGLMEIQPARDPNWKRLIVGSEIGQGDRIRAGIAGEAQIR
ncbi:MAG: hypothetical protein ACK2T3_10570, partial [Candidatus Promineifilaceae bacterium]